MANLLLTYSMQHSPSWEANRFSASQEIPCILWNPKVHYRIHTSPHLSLSSVSSIQFMPSTSQFLKIYLNIILPSTPGSSRWALSFISPHQNPVYASHLSYRYYMPHPFYSSRFKITEEYWVSSTDLWRIKDQLDDTCFVILLLMCWTCFGH